MARPASSTRPASASMTFAPRKSPEQVRRSLPGLIPYASKNRVFIAARRPAVAADRPASAPSTGVRGRFGNHGVGGHGAHDNEAESIPKSPRFAARDAALRCMQRPQQLIQNRATHSGNNAPPPYAPPPAAEPSAHDDDENAESADKEENPAEIAKAAAADDARCNRPDYYGAPARRAFFELCTELDRDRSSDWGSVVTSPISLIRPQSAHSASGSKRDGEAAAIQSIARPSSAGGSRTCTPGGVATVAGGNSSVASRLMALRAGIGRDDDANSSGDDSSSSQSTASNSQLRMQRAKSSRALSILQGAIAGNAEVEDESREMKISLTRPPRTAEERAARAAKTAELVCWADEREWFNSTAGFSGPMGETPLMVTPSAHDDVHSTDQPAESTTSGKTEEKASASSSILKTTSSAQPDATDPDPHPELWNHKKRGSLIHDSDAMHAAKGMRKIAQSIATDGNDSTSSDDDQGRPKRGHTHKESTGSRVIGGDHLGSALQEVGGWAALMHVHDFEQHWGPLVEPSPATPYDRCEMGLSKPFRATTDTLSAPVVEEDRSRHLVAGGKKRSGSKDATSLAMSSLCSGVSSLSTSSGYSRKSMATSNSGAKEKTGGTSLLSRSHPSGAATPSSSMSKRSMATVAVSASKSSLRRKSDAVSRRGSTIEKTAKRTAARAAKERQDHDSVFAEAREAKEPAASNDSPRSTVARHCIASGLRPIPKLILRQRHSTKLDFAHYSLGDEAGMALATGLAAGAPAVRTLNVRDNRLGDEALAAIVTAASKKGDLRALDLSENVLGPQASKVLGQYLSTPTCPLTVLSLERADVDDDECVSLVGEIHRNRKSMLRSLNVARNFIGERESRNVVQPEFVTGAEAIAEWLGSRACVLRALDISWNMIRGDSAVQLGEALATNDSLQHLSVAYNGIGREGGSALGFSLFQNSTLRKLDVSHNSISPSAAYTFAIAIARPRALESIDLSGNPIGETGTCPLLRLPLESGDEGLVNVRIDGCDFRTTDEERCWFKSAMPAGTHELELSRPYDYAVGSELIHLAAMRAEAAITKLTIFSSHGKPLPGETLKDAPLGSQVGQVTLSKVTPTLEQLEDRAEAMPHSDAAHNLRGRGRRVSNASVADQRRLLADRFDRTFATTADITRIFREIDVDGSGTISLDELSTALDILEVGCEDEDELIRIFMRYDLDGTGQLEADEFNDMIESRRVALERAAAMTQPIIVDANASPADALKPYQLPRGGRAIIVFDSKFVERANNAAPARDNDLQRRRRERAMRAAQRTTPSLGVKRLIDMVQAQGSGADRGAMLLMALPYVRLKADEAADLHQSLVKELGDTTRALAAELPQAATPMDARLMVEMYAPSATQKRLLREKLGPEFPIIMGQFTGHFTLNLSEMSHQRALDRILLLNDNEKFAHMTENGPDVSQYGACDADGGDFFRNATLDGKPLLLASRIFEDLGPNGELPPARDRGRLVFEYASISRPNAAVRPLTIPRFNALMKVMGVKAAASASLRTEELAKRRKHNARVARARKQRTQARQMALNDNAIATHEGEQPLQPDDPAVKSPTTRKTSTIEAEPKATNAEVSLLLSLGTNTAPQTVEMFSLGQSCFVPMDHPQKPVLPRRPKRTRTAHAQRDEATKLLMMSQRASLQSDWSSAPQLGTGGSAPVVAKAAPATVMGKKLRGAILHVRGEKAAKDQDLAKALGLMTEFSATGMKVHSRKTLCRANGTASPSGPGSPGPLTPARMKAKVIFKDPDRESAKEFQDRLKSNPELLARMRRVGKLVLQAAEIRQVPIPSSSFAAGAAKLSTIFLSLRCNRPIDPFEQRAATRIEAASALYTCLDHICCHWFSAKQAKLLLMWFPLPTLAPGEQVEFGTLVEIAIAIHPRIIDLWNYDLVLSALSSDDRAEVIDRLGWQNTWSPLKPDGAYSLNLSNKNDRLVAKALIHLEAAESSRRLKGFTDVTFQRTRETEPVIGFVMPKAWLSRSGLPTQGILTVRYSSEVSLEERRPPLKLEIHDDAHGGPGSPVEKKKKKKRTIDKNTASRLQLKLKAAIRGQSPADLFRKYDATGDDLLDETELLRLIRVDLKIMPGELTDEDVGMLVTNLDDDGSGTLSIPELVDFVERGVATFNSGPLKIDTAVAEKLLKALRGATTYQKVFGKFDTSGDGKLDAGELLALVRDDLNILSDEVADQDVRSLAVALDDDGSGTLSIEELASFVEFGTDAIAIGRSSNIDKSIANQIQAAMKAATTHTKLFAEFDASGDGLLNPSELNRMIRKDLKVLPAEVSDADIGLLVKALDDDGSGTLAIHELVDFIEHGTATFFAAGAEKKIGDAVANRLQTALKEATAGVSPLELLKEFDESGDGNLNAHEFVKLVRTDLKIAEDQVTDEDIAMLVKALDDDGSATVGIHELADFIERGTATFGEGPEKIDEEAALKLQKRLQRALKGKDPQSFFESFDDSGDGMLDANELMLLIRTALKISAEDISDNDVSILVRALDDDGSGTLAIDEIIDFVEKGTETFFSGGKSAKKSFAGPDWTLRVALTAVTTLGYPAFDEEFQKLLPEGITTPTIAWANELLRERVPREMGTITWRYDDVDCEPEVALEKAVEAAVLAKKLAAAAMFRMTETTAASPSRGNSRRNAARLSTLPSKSALLAAK